MDEHSYLHAWRSKWAGNAIKWLLRWDERELLRHKRGFSPIHIPFHPCIYDRHNVLRNAVLWKPSRLQCRFAFDWPWQMESSLFIIRNSIQHSGPPFWPRAFSRPRPRAHVHRHPKGLFSLKVTRHEKLRNEHFPSNISHHSYDIPSQSRDSFHFREELAMKIGLTEARIQVSHLLTELNTSAACGCDAGGVLWTDDIICILVSETHELDSGICRRPWALPGSKKRATWHTYAGVGKLWIDNEGKF